jgi:microcystin-dependent protein
LRLLASSLREPEEETVAEPFLGEIRIFAGNFAPRGWTFCDGQLLPIAQNTALFAIFGTTYGGDGRTTFGVPNLRGRAPMHGGNGAGLTQRRLGQLGGTTTEPLSEAQMPVHTHTAAGSPGDQDTADPQNNAWGVNEFGDSYRGGDTPAGNVTMGAGLLQPTGGGQPHNNLQPYLVLNFIVALVGLFPTRN